MGGGLLQMSTKLKQGLVTHASVEDAKSLS